MARKAIARKPGRPPASEGRDRAADIIEAARARFAGDGFDGASLSKIAADADLTLAALYHYFDDKIQLFEMVYRLTLHALWEPWIDGLASLDPSLDLAARCEAVMTPGDRPDDEHTDFFAGAQVAGRRIPELRHLLDERDMVRQRAFAALLGDLGDRGRVRGCSTNAEAIALLEVIFTGWTFEGYFQPSRRDEHHESAMRILRTLTVE
ncbi:TetR/AcrR family transcriptional regulator [Rhodococcus sp. NPDC056960]|uniref:TetR/AcrR family transcriptional regulator n=1 Tax=Rhodococcus sp. NPDC056960 TaxID=3345982 RepID=UPI003631D9E8